MLAEIQLPMTGDAAVKTGIVTVYSPLDYGNRLQNYAMHVILSGLGLECETLVPRQNKKSTYRRRRENHIRMMYRNDPAEAQMKSPSVTRQLRFEEFEARFLPTRRVDSVSFDSGIAKEYRWLVTGGENVWNPDLRDNLGMLKNNLLAFGESCQRICMAPSVGLKELPPHLRDLYHDQWIKFPWLNVRDPEDAQLIWDITGREAKLMLDPVLLVNAEHWRKLMKPLPDFEAQHPYCLIWTSDNENLTDETERIVTELTSDCSCDRYFLGRQGEGPVSTAGPSEYLYLLDHARLAVTDRYYGVVFAAMFGKPFVYTATAQKRDTDICADTARVKSFLERMHISYHTVENNLWVTDIVSDSFPKLSEQAHSVDLLKKMFHLDSLMPQKEVSN